MILLLSLGLVCLELSMPRDLVSLVSPGGEILCNYHSNQDDFQIEVQIFILKVGVYEASSDLS